MASKIDSNVTGLRYAEEASIKVLPGSPVWYPAEPNGYNDFGGQIATIARNPINPSRQRKKGVTTDLDASGGFGQDLTQSNLTRLLQGFLFADMREKSTTQPLNGAAIPITSVTAATNTYAAASGLTIFGSNYLILASGFGQATNNGLKRVISSTASTVVVSPGTVVDEPSPPATAKLQKVGRAWLAGELSVDVSGSYPRLVRASGTFDLTLLGLIPGEWIFIGGDSALQRFVNAENNGFARVRAVDTTYIELDKTSNTMVAETATLQTIRLYFGNVLKNEAAANLIKRRSYQLERTLGEDGSGTMSEYLVGAVPNELSLQIRQADKITADLGFIAVDHEQRDGATGLKSGSRPDLIESDAFNTSSDFTRVKLHQIVDGDTNPSPLFAFFTELTLTVNNNVSPLKAVSVLGAFDVAVGTFAVSGNLTAYFADIAAVQAVRNNADVTLDFALAKNNAGIVVDVPMIALGDGRLAVEQDQPITLPLTVEAAAGANNHTLLFNEFPYLPTLAEG
jgi:hypothetical protein